MSVLVSPPSLPSSRPSTSLSDEDLDFGPVLLSKTMAQRHLDPESPPLDEPRIYTFVDLLNTVLRHNIKLPHPDDEIEDVGSPDVPGGEKKPPQEMTREEIAEELAVFEREVLTDYSNIGKDSFKSRWNSFKAQSGIHDVWSVNDRRLRLGHDPAQTINHLHGKGEIIYHYPEPVFRLLDLEKEVQDHLMMSFMVGITGGRQVKPYQYQAKRPVQGQYKPLTQCIIALCNSKNTSALRLVELGRHYL